MLPLHSNQHQNRGFLSSFHRHRHTKKQIHILSHTTTMSTQPHDLAQVGIHSVVSYLESHQELKQQTVLITDHSYPELFFRVSGVKRVSFGESIDGENTVKLFEFAHPENLVNFIGDYPHPGIDLFDSSSYIFVRSTPINWNQSQKVFEYVDVFTSAQLHIGLPTQSTSDASIYAAYDRAFWYNRGIEDPTSLEPDDCPAWEAKGPINLKAHSAAVMPGATARGDSGMDDIVISSLYSLRVEDVSSFKDHTFPLLRELTIITKPCEDGSPAVISGIVAPELRRLAIHYRGGVLPIIQNMELGIPLEDVLGGDHDNVTTFELLNLDVHEPSHTQDQIEKRQRIQIDQGFFVNAAIVHLYGTPMGLLQHCNFSDIEGLRWKICERPRFAFPWISKMPELTNISIEVAAAEFVLPRIITRVSHKVFFSITAPLVRIENLWSIRPIGYYYFYLYNSPNLIKAGHAPLISIGYDEVKRAMGLAATHCCISLTGVFLPFLTQDPDEDSTQASEHFDLSICNSATLRPVLSRDTFHPLSEYQGRLFALTGVLLLDKVGFTGEREACLPSLKRKLVVLPLILPPSSDISVPSHDLLLMPVLFTKGGESPIKGRPLQTRHVDLTVSGSLAGLFVSGQVWELEDLRTLSASGSCLKVEVMNQDVH